MNALFVQSLQQNSCNVGRSSAFLSANKLPSQVASGNAMPLCKSTVHDAGPTLKDFQKGNEKIPGNSVDTNNPSKLLGSDTQHFSPDCFSTGLDSETEESVELQCDSGSSSSDESDLASVAMEIVEQADKVTGKIISEPFHCQSNCHPSLEQRINIKEYKVDPTVTYTPKKPLTTPNIRRTPLTVICKKKGPLCIKVGGIKSHDVTEKRNKLPESLFVVPTMPVSANKLVQNLRMNCKQEFGRKFLSPVASYEENYPGKRYLTPMKEEKLHLRLAKKKK
ncbi:hypothetical protein SK128_024329 [Halocaridina rubra]|uniref:Uncharacterized protein n=1 Tax=Halocaridina rubra TaxID=373956 RepID=A0AAN8WP53_HALRR